jgi:hypothetical protein
VLAVIQGRHLFVEVLTVHELVARVESPPGETTVSSPSPQSMKSGDD